MPNGFGWRGGWGFGFRGSSPPWPFVGVGRGGLPRCGYFLSGAAGMPPTYWPSPYFSGAWPSGGYPYGTAYPGSPTGTPPSGANPYYAPPTREQEIELLRGQADMIRAQLEQIQNRIRGLEE